MHIKYINNLDAHPIIEDFEIPQLSSIQLIYIQSKIIDIIDIIEISKILRET